MNRRIKALTVLVAATATAFAAAACDSSGGDSASGVTEVVIGSDLPMQGSSKDASDSTVNAMKLYLEQIGGKAGKYNVTLKVYDDSTAAAGKWDQAQCSKNANDHVANAKE